jgi:hypothetical protein
MLVVMRCSSCRDICDNFIDDCMYIKVNSIWTKIDELVQWFIDFSHQLDVSVLPSASVQSAQTVLDTFKVRFSSLEFFLDALCSKFEPHFLNNSSSAPAVPEKKHQFHRHPRNIVLEKFIHGFDNFVIRTFDDWNMRAFYYSCFAVFITHNCFYI